MSKSLTAIVFLAGPISGLVVQPLIGMPRFPAIGSALRPRVGYRCARRQLKVPFRPAAPLHARWRRGLRVRPRSPGVHASVRRRVHQPGVFCRQPPHCVAPRVSNTLAQNDSLTVFLAVWAIYCIDFSINAGQPRYAEQMIQC